MRSFIVAALAALAALTLAGCNTTSEQIVIAGRFDPKEAEFVRREGTARIEGQAFVKQANGKPMFAVGETVRLIPATAYARERFGKLYGGRRFVAAAQYPQQPPADPAYQDHMRVTKTGPTGRFSFDKAAPGTYFVSTQVVWKPEGAFAASGGAVYDTVTVTGRETEPLRIILSGP